MERLVHNQIKTRFAAVLTLLNDELQLGRFIGDRMLPTNVEAGLSTEPNGMFVSVAAMKASRVV